MLHKWSNGRKSAARDSDATLIVAAALANRHDVLKTPLSDLY